MCWRCANRLHSFLWTTPPNTALFPQSRIMNASGPGSNVRSSLFFFYYHISPVHNEQPHNIPSLLWELSALRWKPTAPCLCSRAGCLRGCVSNQPPSSSSWRSNSLRTELTGQGQRATRSSEMRHVPSFIPRASRLSALTRWSCA